MRNIVVETLFPKLGNIFARNCVYARPYRIRKSACLSRNVCISYCKLGKIRRRMEANLCYVKIEAFTSHLNRAAPTAAEESFMLLVYSIVLFPIVMTIFLQEIPPIVEALTKMFLNLFGNMIAAP